MSDISKIQLPNKTTYEIKDSTARDTISKAVVDIDNLKSLVDVEGSRDALVLNINDEKICLILNDDGSVTWQNCDELINISIIRPTTVDLGNSIVIIGRIAGGTSPYTYKMEAKLSSEQDYLEIKAFGGTAAKEWKPEKTGIYTVRVTVRDNTGKSVSKSITLTVNPELINNSTLSATNINYGESITFTGKAEGGTSPYTYKFEAKHSSTHINYHVIQDFSDTATKKWQPAKTGTYSVRITVKDGTGADIEKYFDITVNAVEGEELLGEENFIYDEEGFI